MTARLPLLTLSVLSAAAGWAGAGEPVSPLPGSDGTAPAAQSRWRFGAGYAPMLGLKTEFSGLGQFHSAFSPQALGGGTNYTYDNGFVHVDSSNNLGGKTWNWGYDANSQYHAAGSGSIDYSLTNSLADGRVSEDSAARQGFECYAYLDMGAVTLPALKDLGASWGFRGGIHYTRVNADNGNLVAAGVTTLSDSFDLGGTLPPLAPFSGSFGGPGPLINDAPSRLLATGGQALVVGSRALDVDLTTFNLGAYLEVPLTRKLSVMLEAGFSAAIAAGTYDFNSATSIAGLGTQQSSGHDASTSVLPGVYVGLDGIYQLNQSWAIQAAARYQYMHDYSLSSNGSSAALSFNSAFVLSIGVRYSF